MKFQLEVYQDKLRRMQQKFHMPRGLSWQLLHLHWMLDRPM